MKIKTGFMIASLAAVTVAWGCGKTRQAQGERQGRAPDARQDEQLNALQLEGATATLRLLETTDLHVNMETFDYYQNAPSKDYGLARTASLIRAARAEVKNSLLVDNGDLIQGSPLGDWFQKEMDPKVDLHPVFKAMNLLQYDVANVGNHEFNYGVDFLEQTLKGARFPYVSANVMRAGEERSFIDQYVILKRTITLDDGRTDELKIGVIGFVPPQIMNWDRSNLLGRLEAKDIVDTANALVPRIKAEGADVVVAVPHSGINPAPRVGGDENAVYYLSQIEGIDAILSGHSHRVFPDKSYEAVPNADLAKGTINGVPVVMAGSWGSHLGVVDLGLKKVGGRWTVVSGQGSARVAKALGDAHEADVRAVVAEDHLATLKYLQTQVGVSESPLHSFFSLLTPSSAVQIVHDAQLWYGKKLVAEGGAETAALRGLPILSAAAPLKAGGKTADYSDVAAGPLTLRSVADLYVYPNTVKIVKIRGAQVKDWLEMAARAFNQVKPNDASEQLLLSTVPAYNFDSLLGVSYEIDVSQPARFDGQGKLVDPSANRIVNLTYNGAPIDPAQDFLVVTNNYRANGGGQFPGLNGEQVVLDPNRESRDALREYVQAVGTVGKAPEQHWRLKPVPGATNVLYRTAKRALTLLNEVDALLEPLRGEDDKYALYRVRW